MPTLPAVSRDAQVTPTPSQGGDPPATPMSSENHPWLETDRTTTLDPQARLAVLLATTGLTQLDLAKLLGVASRTVRRWM
jgi:hypothetical protein